MTAQDFRIGNWVISYFREGIPQQVVAIDRGCVDLNFGERLAFENEEILPIPLTIEILEKYGFKEKYADTWFPHWQIKHTRINGIVEYTFKISTMGDNEWRWIEGNVNVPIYYVHELQNLLHALKIEITINL